MQMVDFSRLTDIGVTQDTSHKERRAIVLSNYVSYVLQLVNLLIFLLIPENHNLSGAFESLVGAILLSLPLVLNRIHLYSLSRLYLCWLPPFMVLLVSGMLSQKEAESFTPAIFDGLRYYLVGLSCLPYLLFSTRTKLLLFLGIIPTLFPILFFDSLLSFFVVGFNTMEVVDPFYQFSFVRSFVSYTIIGGSCLALKRLVEIGDRRNSKLVEELEKKNAELHKLATEEFEEVSQKADQLIKDSEARFSTAFKYSAIGMALVSVDGFFLQANNQFCHFMGYSEEELKRLTFRDVTYPADLNSDLVMVSSLIQGERKTFKKEKRYIHKNGVLVWANISVSLIRDAEDKPVYFVVQAEDITSRKLLEKEQALLASIVSSSEDAIMSVSTDGAIISWNPGAEAIFGYYQKEMIGKSISVLAPIDHPIAFEIFSAIHRGESIDHREVRWKRKDGNLIYLSISVSTMRDDQDQNIGSAIIGRDVTFKVLADEALRESEDRYRTLVEAATEALFIVDVELGKFVQVSESAVEMFKIPSEQLLDLNPSHISPEFQPDGKRSDEEAFRLIKKATQGEKVSFLWQHLDSDGRSFPCEVRLVRLPSENRLLVRGSVIDISERVAKEKELLEANQKMGEMKLMALRSVMSPHFVFNVLNSIQYYIAKSDRLNAINYLSTFSKLIRSVLTHSVDNMINLADEIDLLKNYVSLEQIRFEDKFDVEFDIDPNLDISSIEIPSLLLQPYVENAIIHGLYNKIGHGKLKISFEEEDDNIKVVIEDDGVGREVARKLREQSATKHKSMGIKLTEERLQLINQEGGANFETEDLYNNGVPAGTRVTVKLKEV